MTEAKDWLDQWVSTKYQQKYSWSSAAEVGRQNLPVSHDDFLVFVCQHDAVTGVDIISKLDFSCRVFCPRHNGRGATHRVFRSLPRCAHDYTWNCNSFIHLFVSDNKVHRLSLHKRTKQTDRDGYNLTTTQPADYWLNGRTHLTTALSQTATLSAKLTLQLWIRVLKTSTNSSCRQRSTWNHTMNSLRQLYT